MSTDAYAADKALAHPERLQALREGRQPYPVHLHLVISDLCNSDCGGCAYRMSGYSSNALFNGTRPDGSVTHNPNRMLPIELIKQILDDCQVMGTRAVEFTGGGEPTVHPQVLEALEYAQALGLDTALITNGLRLYKVGEAAVRTKWLRVSIDAATPEMYAAVRPSFGEAERPLKDRSHSQLDFHRAIVAVKDAVGRRRLLDTDCTIGAGFVVQRENWRELYDAVKLYKSLGVNNVRISGLFTPEGDAYHEEYREAALTLEQRAIADFDGKDGFRVHGRFGEKLSDLAGPPTYLTCSYQHLTTYIGGDARLYRCCVTSYNPHGLLGNVAEAGGFKALWDRCVRENTIINFDARSCTRCQFNDRNRLLNAAIAASVQPVPPNVVHKNFV